MVLPKKHVVVGALAAAGAAGALRLTACRAETAPSPAPAPAASAHASAAPSAAAPPDAGALADAGPPIRFVAIGDTGKGHDGQRRVAKALDQKCRRDGCDFVAMLGDNIYPSGVTSVDDPQWDEKFEKIYAATDVEFLAVLGNHDYGGGGAGNEFAKGQHEVDYTKRSTKWRMPAAYWHAIKGPIELFGLDSNMQLFGRDADQRRDVGEWLSASTARWKIALAHHPYRSNGLHGNAGRYDGVFVSPASGDGVRRFDEELVCGKVDLLLTGHDHSRQWLTETCKGTELVVSGTGAEITDLPGKNPVRFQALTLGFVYVIVTHERVVVEFVDEAGTTEFSHGFAKP